MSWFRRSLSRTGVFGKPRRKHQAGRGSATTTEQLEQKLLLGSLVPTETGVPTGDLLPISTVDLLAKHEVDNLSAVDISLMEAGDEFQRMELQLAWLARQQNSQSDAASETGESNGETSADSQSAAAASTSLVTVTDQR